MAENQSTSDAVNLHLTAHPDTDPEAARYMHVDAATGVIYGNAIQRCLGPLFERLNMGQSAITHAEEMMRRMAPCDPLE